MQLNNIILGAEAEKSSLKENNPEMCQKVDEIVDKKNANETSLHRLPLPPALPHLPTRQTQ